MKKKQAKAALQDPAAKVLQSDFADFDFLVLTTAVDIVQAAAAAAAALKAKAEKEAAKVV
jgi:hypothetical protein